MYSNSVDAFQQLLASKQDSAGVLGVSRISSSIRLMSNGIAYCVVQVVCSRTEEYRIEAYGEEAEELYRTANEQSALCVG